jgi:hypothetical protein
MCLKGEHSIAKPGTDWIGHDKVKAAGINVEDLPVIKDYTGRAVCAVCGNKETQYHHWMPKHLVTDGIADQWPGDYLCKYHHDMWHRIVTPNMHMRKRKDEHVQDRSIQSQV